MFAQFSPYKIISFFFLLELVTFDDFLNPPNISSTVVNCGGKLILREHPDVVITGDATVSQLLATLQRKGHSLSKPCISLDMVYLLYNTAKY